MSMTPAVRKLALTAHVTSSVGWLGAVASFLVLSIAGVTSPDAGIVRAAYLGMNFIGWYAIVPLGVAALITGIIQSLGTPWGLFRHYWVLVKLVLTIGATLLLLLHQFTAVTGAAERIAMSAAGAFPEVGPWGTQLVADAGAALFVLLVTTVIAVYKPWGLTPYGRKISAGSAAGAATVPRHGDAKGTALPLSWKILFVAIGLAVATFIALHVAGRGLGHNSH